MLSRDCDACSQMRLCAQRFRLVTKDNGSKVYCANGEAHLVDQ